MKMITTLAGPQLQKNMAKRKLATMSSVREDQEDDAGEENKNPYFAYHTERSLSLMSAVDCFS